MTVKIATVERPYLLTFHSSGQSYLLTADSAQRLLDEYSAQSATRYCVVLHGHNSVNARDRTTLRPATLGGGPAFLISK